LYFDLALVPAVAILALGYLAFASSAQLKALVTRLTRNPEHRKEVLDRIERWRSGASIIGLIVTLLITFTESLR
jgi:hypothetical protein